MNGFRLDLSCLAGNRALRERLQSLAGARGLPHAMLICGGTGMGKHHLANLLSAAWVCESEGGRPCRVCRACRKVEGGLHPDVVRLGGEGQEAVAVAQVRALRGEISIRPNEAPYKIYILERAELLNQSAQNALLKLLEDSPHYARFLFLLENPDVLLETVRSRCAECLLLPLGKKELEDYLAARFPNAAHVQVLRAAAQAEGSAGKAVSILDGEADGLIAEAALSFEGMFEEGEEATLFRSLLKLEKWAREDQLRFLQESEAAVFCKLRAASVQPQAEREPFAASLCARAGRTRAERLAAIEILRKAQAMCRANVSGGHLMGYLAAELGRIVAKGALNI